MTSTELVDQIQSDITKQTDRVLSPTPVDSLASAAQIVIDTQFGGPRAINVRPKEAAMNAAVRYLAQTLSRFRRE